MVTGTPIKPLQTSRHLLTAFGLGGNYSFLTYKSKINFEFSSGDYIVKIATHFIDVIKALQLRHKVFLGEKVTDPRWKIDLDRYDYLADHLIVFHKKKKKIVGTYRFLCSKFYNSFYSASEFDISNILFIDETKLEVGRACIHPDFRNRAVLQLLWKGIAEYLKFSGAKYLFGCSSIPSTPINSAIPIHKYLIDNFICEDAFKVYPKIKAPQELLHPEGKSLPEGDKNISKIRNHLPPLLRGYLDMGCKICGDPAYDKDFETFDYFTLLEIEKLNPQFFKKFL